MASLRYTLNYLHSSQQIFSLRSNIGEGNVTFKWLVCTSQESIKIRTRGKERNRAKERYSAREKEIQSRARRKQSARGSFNHGNLQTTLIKVLAVKIWWYASSWSSDVNYFLHAPVWPGARIRVLLHIAKTSRAPYLTGAQTGSAGNQTGSKILI